MFIRKTATNGEDIFTPTPEGYEQIAEILSEFESVIDSGLDLKPLEAKDKDEKLTTTYTTDTDIVLTLTMRKFEFL